MNSKKLRVGVVDLVTKGPERGYFSRVMKANLVGIMAQVVAAWCEREGHDVTYVCYTGVEDLAAELPSDADVVFIAAFTEAAQLAYAVSNMYRRRGAVTVLGGPHARCYPQDACRYFDYVLGFTHRSTVQDVLRERAPHRPMGRLLDAGSQPGELPGVEERWKFIAAALRKAPLFKIVPMIGSLGCPYTCNFCIDAEIPYQPLDFDLMKRDLRFLLGKFRHPIVAWHDPNFGVRFDDFLDAIEEAVPPGRMDHIAESSLSLLSEAHVRRMRRAGFKGLLPGIESWFGMGDKSRSLTRSGMEKVRAVADHVNMILEHVPYVQTNFVLGMDCDEGAEPFELTKTFVDLCPGAFPGYSLLTAFGQAAPLNLEYQREGRVLPFPFFLLNNHSAMNVIPRHYDWKTLYDHVIDVTHYSFSWRAVARRFHANDGMFAASMNVLRGVSNEGTGRVRFFEELRRKLDDDVQLQRYFAGDSRELPPLYVRKLQRFMGPFFDELPEGALDHDQNAYLRASSAAQPVTLQRPRTPGATAVLN